MRGHLSVQGKAKGRPWSQKDDDLIGRRRASCAAGLQDVAEGQSLGSLAQIRSLCPPPFPLPSINCLAETGMGWGRSRCPSHRLLEVRLVPCLGEVPPMPGTTALADWALPG
jgi:hypothetical protein